MKCSSHVVFCWSRIHNFFYVIFFLKRKLLRRHAYDSIIILKEWDQPLSFHLLQNFLQHESLIKNKFMTTCIIFWFCLCIFRGWLGLAPNPLIPSIPPSWESWTNGLYIYPPYVLQKLWPKSMLNWRLSVWMTLVSSLSISMWIRFHHGEANARVKLSYM